MFENIFYKKEFDENKLCKYGFKKNNNLYVFMSNMKISNFKIIISIDIIENSINYKVIDLDLNEEYINYKFINQVGTFVGSIRNEIENILLDISNNCTISKNFVSNQADRISKQITEKYNNTIEFPWDRSGTDDGIFRNVKTKKWYALIMTIQKNKLIKDSNDNSYINIINLKLDEEKITSLVNTNNSFFRAYHMNKQKWITAVLDDSIGDSYLMELIDESYNYSNIKK